MVVGPGVSEYAPKWRDLWDFWTAMSPTPGRPEPSTTSINLSLRLNRKSVCVCVIATLGLMHYYMCQD